MVGKSYLKNSFYIVLLFLFNLNLLIGQTQTFNYTGGSQSWTVPPCVYQVTVVANGAQGGGTNGGLGATVTATLNVCPGDNIVFNIGGQGGCGNNSGGYNGAGTGYSSLDGNPNYHSCGGGGATSVSVNGNPLSIAAGGGGTGGGSVSGAINFGGAGGCNTGGTGGSTFGTGATGGTQNSGGTGGLPWAGTPPGGSNGALGQGGQGGLWNTASGGGGGGGYYGGGGGGNDGCCTGANGGGGGGGGSSLVPAGGNCTQGGNAGNGSVVISYSLANTPPTGNAPANLTFQCLNDVPAPNPNQVTGLTADACGNFPTVSHLNDVSNGTCPTVITRTYRIEDDCGNFTDVAQTITVDDNIAPTGNAPANLTVQCIGDVPAPNTNSLTGVNDNCTANPTVNHLGDISNGTCPTVITRTYRIEDDCGNFTDVTQTITANDNIAPTGNAPANLTVQCVGDVPIPNTNSVTGVNDNCTANPTVDHLGDVSNGTCPEIITRTYRIEDDCGNFTDVTQTITVDDDIAPSGNAPANLTVQCIGDVPVPNTNSVTGMNDNCTANPTVDHLGDVSNGACPEIITRTYRIEDDCGNFTDVTQTITVDDDIAPTGNAPANLTVQCVGDVPVPNTNSVTGVNDNCTANPTIDHLGDVSNGTCPEIITRTYRIEDDCGNFTDVTQTITVNDDIDPTGNAPANLTVQCVNDVPMPNIGSLIGVSDNCTANPAVTHLGDVSDGNTCPEIITRSYRIEDDCGNFIDVTQTITIDDDTNPTASNPATINVACATDVPNPNPAVVIDANDNCGTPVVAHVSDVTNGNVCNGEEITRTYSVTDACGNSITVTQVIIIDAVTPVFTLSYTDPTECAANDGTITISGLLPNTNYDFSYNGGAIIPIVSDGTGEYILTGLGAGSYTNFVVAAGGCPDCFSTDNTVLNLVDPNPPAIDAGPNQTVCDGDQVTVVAINPDGANITWDNGVVDGTPFTPGVGTTTYTVTADLNNCISTDQMDVTVNPLPTIGAGADQTVCDGDLITLVANNPDGANITWDNGVTDGVPFTQVVGTTTYTVTADLLGCINTDEVDVTVNPNPTYTLTYTDPTECGGTDGTITISGLDANENYEYTYNGGGVNPAVSNGNGEIVITGLSAGSYTNFTVTLNGCTTTDNTVLNLVDPNAPFIDAGPDQTICDGDQVTLVAINPDDANITWDNGVVDGTPFTPGVGTITYTVTADLDGCISTDQVVVTVTPLPVVNAGNDIEVCEGESIILSASGADTYIWSNGVPNNSSFEPTTSGAISVIGEVNGCTNFDSLYITVNPLSPVVFSSDVSVGCIPLTVEFSNDTPGTFSSCTWQFSNGETINSCTDFQYEFTEPGCYDVTLTIETQEGCVSQATQSNMICVDDYPVADFFVTPDQLTNISNTAYFNNTSSGATEYFWSFGPDEGTSTETNPNYSYGESEGVYEAMLIAYSQFGCSDTVFKNVEVVEDLIFWVPNSFTPDDNKYNESFKPVFHSGFDPFDYNLLIFNRWGEVLFESNNAEFGWNGTYDGEIVKDGTYVWKIEFKTKYTDERVVKVGHVNLLR
jgi:gliding motility-associated-like protein